MADPEKSLAAMPSTAAAANDEKGPARMGSMVSINHPIDADEAMNAFAGLEAGETLVLDEATNKRILRRIDLHIMPIMCIVYAMNFLDKTTLSYASIMGLGKDLGLVGSNYQWLGSLFYFGYRE